jgi:hypothetical protein
MNIYWPSPANTGVSVYPVSKMGNGIRGSYRPFQSINR